MRKKPARLELSLDLVEKLLDEPELQRLCRWFCSQAYSKRCESDWLFDYMAREKQALFDDQIGKGAYWDEIKWAQTDGLNAFPLYSEKITPIFLSCLCEKIACGARCDLSAIATHNVQ